MTGADIQGGIQGAIRGAAAIDPAGLRYGPDGLLPVVVQEVASGALLMLAWADREAVERTLATGEACFWSRSRRRPWRKGESSGNVLRVVEARVDCDADALLLRADPAGLDRPACHRGTRSCFDPPPPAGDGPDAGVPVPPALELGWLAGVIAARRAAPRDDSYTARLLAAGVERIARKVGEEATEVVIAALGCDRDAGTAGASERRDELAGEAADLLYHLLVLLESCGVSPGEVARILRRRHLGDRASDGTGTASAPEPEEVP